MRWLDGVRYADTAGYHSDSPRPVWPYRDYVLRAFRDNKPFDVFTREQLAGDLMPHATFEEKEASAYNRMGRTSAEGGVQPKEYLAKYGAERVRALSTNWLGATMGCAECHNHKFDPILTKDFYAMKAFFADVKEKGLVLDTGTDAFAPKMPVYKPGEKEKIDALDQQIQNEKSALDKKADALADERREWEKSLLTHAAAGGLAWTFPIPAAVSAKSAKLSVETAGWDENDQRAHPLVKKSGGPGLIVVSGPNPDNETYSVTLKPGAGRLDEPRNRGGHGRVARGRRYRAWLRSFHHQRNRRKLFARWPPRAEKHSVYSGVQLGSAHQGISGDGSAGR